MPHGTSGPRAPHQKEGDAQRGQASAQRSLALVTLVVPDYDAAIGFFTEVMGFRLVEDTPLDAGKRWVIVAPGAGGAALLLAKAANPRQANRIGDQTGGRVGFFLQTDDFWRDHRRMEAAGVAFLEAPRAETYGIVVKFCDPFGNVWDLLERRGPENPTVV